MHCKKLHKIGETKVFGVLNKIKTVLKVFVIGAISLTSSAYANEITAIDFNGDVIGKVIPDGSVIGMQNNVIGKITADSFIVNNKGDIIGGIVPQGVAIGNDNRLLGKVNNDGTVRLPTGKIIAKVLPNALVVDDSYNVLGSVLYPGLIYDDEGKTVGRLTGDGLYISMEGQNIGFVSPLGYAYRNNGTGYTLDGRLISSKMVVSSDGKFIGSISPGGKVTDFDTKIIGSVHANGYVYNENYQVIGKTVTNGYAFDNIGNYLGVVSYNGEVIKSGKITGKLRADDKIINEEGKVIGFNVEIMATATDLKGKYLGRILPEGKVARARDIIGRVGAKGFIYNDNGKVIGQVSYAGPVFDYLGNFVASTLRNGTVVSTSGALLGYVQGNHAYDNIGRMLGSKIGHVQVVNSSNNILGLSGIGSEFKSSNVPYRISPYGYVYSIDNSVVGNILNLSALYKEDGTISGYLGINGQVEGIPTEKEAKINQFGMIVDPSDEILGYKIDAYYAVQANGMLLGYLAENNMITDDKFSVIAKIVPENKAVVSTSVIDDKLMPVIGYTGKNYIAVGFNGNMLGYAQYDGQVLDFQKNMIGTVVENDLVLGVDKSILGKLVGFSNVVSDDCSFLGIVSTKGDVRNTRDMVVGKILSNGQVVSETSIVHGFTPLKGVVLDFKGKNIGTVNILGRVLNYANADMGCIRSDGRLYNSENVFKGAVVQPSPVISYENAIVGRILSSGKVVDINNKMIGYVLPNGNVMSTDGNKVVGMAFKYKFAFDKDNNFLGRVNDNAEVVSNDNKVLAKVRHDGSVFSGRNEIGYALYDVYIYDENGKAIGYITKGGTVNGFSGNKLGQSDRGFLVDKNYNIVGRGSRDYFLRNSTNEIVGELLINGEMVDNTQSVIGNLLGNGEIRNDEGKLIAKAQYLQYYNVQKVASVKPSENKDSNIKIGEIVAPTHTSDIDQDSDFIFEEDGTDSSGDRTEAKIGKYGLKAIGIALTPDGNYLGDILQNNDVIDKLGNLIGKKMPDGLIIDDQGGLIGVEEVNKTSADKMFVPSGSFGDGAAYGVGNQPNNLGPGGGYGAGERYDPVRAQILNETQNVRRSELSMAKVSTGFSKKAFDGTQPSWDKVPRKIASWRVDMSEMILADKPIPAVLSRTLMSGAENVPVTAIVERNVYAEVGRNIIIPAGSRVMGEMNSFGSGDDGSGGGAVRVNILWTRLIRPDGSAFEFADAQTGDAQGKAGALGYLDEQLLKKYTLPIFTELLTDATAFMMAAGENSSDGDGGSTQDTKSEAATDARQNFLSGMKQIFEQILNNKTNIKSVAYVPAGTRVIIYPKVDLWLRTAERELEEAKDESVAPTTFTNDQDSPEHMGKNKKNSTPNSSGGSTVEVYGGTESDAQPSGIKLVEDEPPSKKNQQKPMPSYAAVPQNTGGMMSPTSPPPSGNSAGSAAVLY